MDDLIEWLLQGEPWVQYRVRVDLLGQAETSREVAQARKAMVAHPEIRSLTKELKELPNTVITSHKSAGQDWEFGQKREPSRWLTFLVLRIFNRMGLAIQ